MTLTRTLLTFISRCRWLPVELPVEPTYPSLCPLETLCPTLTMGALFMCAYSVE